MDPIVQIVIAVIGSGAFFTFIQFLIQRKDSRANKINQLCDKIDEGLERQEKLSEERYSTLQLEIQEGLEDREQTGKTRYLEHKEAIQKLNEAIFQLTKNDTEQTEYMRCIGESLIGLSHDKIIRFSDKVLERGGITLKEKATLQSIYNPYRKLGGNSDCVVAFNAVSELPIISDDKAKEMDKELKIEKYFMRGD